MPTRSRVVGRIPGAYRETSPPEDESPPNANGAQVAARKGSPPGSGSPRRMAPAFRRQAVCASSSPARRAPHPGSARPRRQPGSPFTRRSARDGMRDTDRRPDARLRDAARRRQRVARSARRGDLRVPGAQRLGQDDHDPPAAGPARAHARHGHGPRPRRGVRGGRDPGAVRRPARALGPLRAHDRAGQPRVLRSRLAPVAGRTPWAGPRAALRPGAVGSTARDRGRVEPRHEAEARRRARVAPPSRPRLPRRADCGTRPDRGGRPARRSDAAWRGARASPSSSRPTTSARRRSSATRWR